MSPLVISKLVVTPALVVVLFLVVALSPSALESCLLASAALPSLMVVHCRLDQKLPIGRLHHVLAQVLLVSVVAACLPAVVQMYQMVWLALEVPVLSVRLVVV